MNGMDGWREEDEEDGRRRRRRVTAVLFFPLDGDDSLVRNSFLLACLNIFD